MVRFRLLVILILLPTLLCGQIYLSHSKLADGLRIETREGTLTLTPMADNAVRVRLEKQLKDNTQELVFLKSANSCSYTLQDKPAMLQLITSRMVVRFDKQTGQLSYANRQGAVFLSEKPGCRSMVDSKADNEPCYSVEQTFETDASEAIFGLGQFQDGHYNLNGITRRLTQVNTQIAIPFIYSSKGYGLLWHQYGLIDFNPADNPIELKRQEASITDENQVAEVTTTSGTQKVTQNQRLYNARFSVPRAGEYSLFLDLGDMGNRHFIAVDGKTCVDQSNMWLPPTVSTLVKLSAGEHRVEVLCKADNSPKLFWNLRTNSTTFRSPVAKSLDYVVFYGPSADEVMASYRHLSGHVPLFPLWAYGFWQCRERYSSGKQLVETVNEFRKRNIPMDVIVQDWQYWGNRGWGVPVFDSVHYANPAGFIEELHNQHAHFNISIWSNPDRNSSVGREFVAKNLYIPNQSKWLDYFNPETRRTYWNVLNQNMFSQGVDSWWMDAVEPENDALKGQQTHIGSGELYRLSYPYMVSKAVYEGQRQTSDSKRVCILTRSAFPGQQRFGVINWSGDIGGDWDSYRRQIVAGLNYSLTGFAYWTTDIGGFFRPGKSQYSDKNYHELLTRWYQWGAFNPIFRIHGYMSETEPWKYGSAVENNMRSMLSLRYQLLPYIYSWAWQVTSAGSTLMRPLVMDFDKDTTAVHCPYQYMFGKSLLVAPVTQPDSTTWRVYLPGTASWYDFYTGKLYNAQQTVEADAPLDKIPLFVKAGSILPIGPEQQYATEKKWDKLEIRVYEGANAKFFLYEDENDSYRYEKGLFSTIGFYWDDAKHQLTIDDRKGSFPGMIANRQFMVRFISGQSTPVVIRLVKYAGRKIIVSN